MSLDRFAQIVSQEDLSLAEAFLAFAQAEYPSLDPEHYLLALDRIAERAEAAVRGAASPEDRLEALGSFLTADGFAGNVEDYSDPANSFLNMVLERSVGIPISLSVLWIEVGLRAGVDVVGIGMPMHFLVGVPGRAVFADPFACRTGMTPEDAMILFAQITDGELPWRDEYLQPTSGRAIVRRALTNLKAVYATAGDLRRALWVEDHLLAIPDTPPAELLERATVLQALRRFPEAIADLRTYLQSHPGESEEIEPRIRRLMAAMN